MLDVKGDKTLWERQNLEGVGKVLLVEESYYDGIVEMVEKIKEDLKFHEMMTAKYIALKERIES